MTTSDACALLVKVVRELSDARAAGDRHRLVAQQAIHLLHDQHVELVSLRERYYALLDERRSKRAA